MNELLDTYFIPDITKYILMPYLIDKKVMKTILHIS